MAKAKTAKKRAKVSKRASKPRGKPTIVAHDDVARRAYALYLARGCVHGHDIDDWLQAERELRAAEGSNDA